MERQAVLERYARLYTAVVCDALDDVGQWSQVMSPSIGPLFPGPAKICGYARTLKAGPHRKAPEPVQEEGTWQ